MAIAYKVLGQSEPAATTATTLYTVPSATQAVCSTLSVCNRHTAAATFRVSVRINGAAQTDAAYVCYDAPIAAKDTLFLTVGFTLGAGDVVTVYSSQGDQAFQLFGSEIT